MIWGLFILDPSIVSKYFIIQDVDDQGRPMKIYPISDNKELIKSSPLLSGQSSKLNLKPSINTPYSHVGGNNVETGFDLHFEERENLYKWLIQDYKEEPIKELTEKENESDKSYIDSYRPVVLF